MIACNDHDVRLIAIDALLRCHFIGPLSWVRSGREGSETVSRQKLK